MDFLYNIFDGTVAGLMDILIFLVYIVIIGVVLVKLFLMLRADRKYDTAVLPDLIGETEAMPDVPLDALEDNSNSGSSFASSIADADYDELLDGLEDEATVSMIEKIKTHTI